MADQGKRLPPHTVARLRWLCSVCRLSVRRAAREAGLSTSTAWKYRPKKSPDTA